MKAAPPPQQTHPQQTPHQQTPAEQTPAQSPLPQASADPSNRVAELQVSAHLMALDTGLFCVFQSPGTPPPDPASGLPGVRITPAPGIAGRPEAVTVSTFREDGWLNGTAALVRVTDGSAQILVTIYQHKGMGIAPRLQVLRLSGETDSPTTPDTRSTSSSTGPVPPQPAAANGSDPRAADARPVVNPEVMAHIQRMGDVGCKLGDWLGIKGSGHWVEGFGMAPTDGIALDDIEYQAVLGRNWLSPWVTGGKFCGSRGMALPLLGFKVRLKGDASKAFECSYSATFVDGTAIGPINAGETCEASSLAALESFQIAIRPRATQPAAKPRATNPATAKTPIAKTPTAKTPMAKTPAPNPPQLPLPAPRRPNSKPANTKPAIPAPDGTKPRRATAQRNKG